MRGKLDTTIIDYAKVEQHEGAVREYLADKPEHRKLLAELRLHPEISYNDLRARAGVGPHASKCLSELRGPKLHLVRESNQNWYLTPTGRTLLESSPSLLLQPPKAASEAQVATNRTEVRDQTGELLQEEVA